MRHSFGSSYSSTGRAGAPSRCRRRWVRRSIDHRQHRRRCARRQPCRYPSRSSLGSSHCPMVRLIVPAKHRLLIENVPKRAHAANVDQRVRAAQLALSSVVVVDQLPQDQSQACAGGRRTARKPQIREILLFQALSSARHEAGASRRSSSRSTRPGWTAKMAPTKSHQPSPPCASSAVAPATNRRAAFHPF